MNRTIYALELTLYRIELAPNGPSEGERIVSKTSVMSHYDGSRQRPSAEAAYAAADAALKAAK